MPDEERSQNGSGGWEAGGQSAVESRHGETGRREKGRWRGKAGKRRPEGGLIPNPKAKLLDQVREVMRVRHYSLRTERS